jgi:ABC-type transporter Mla subunit MlaD
MKTSAYRPFEVAGKDRIVGVFVIGAILLFLLGFLIPFIQRLSADEGALFYTVLDQTYGIAPEATVSLRGVVIGHVTRVAITGEGMVRVDMSLSQGYARFYTQQSRLAVDGNIGVNTILTGSGLILTPGPTENDLLELGEYIPTEKPQGIATLLKDLDIVQLANQVTEIVANVQAITAGLNNNQDKIYRSLANLETVTQSLAEVSQRLPDMVTSVDRSLGSLEGTLTNIDGVIQRTDDSMQGAMQNITLLTAQASTTLAETEILMRASTPVMAQLPTVMVTTDVALQSITRLTNQLGQSWLLGGGKNSPPPLTGLASHPHDNSLYEVEPPLAKVSSKVSSKASSKELQQE